VLLCTIFDKVGKEIIDIKECQQDILSVRRCHRESADESQEDLEDVGYDLCTFPGLLVKLFAIDR
jgi:hypothetical protein